MNALMAPQVTAESLNDICRQMQLGEAALGRLSGSQKPEEYLALLVDDKLYRDALRWTAVCLPKRQAVWWGCLCAWQVYRPSAPAKEAAALEATVRWVQSPTEPNRRQAHAQGTAAGADTPAGGLAMGAFLSQGSISLPGLPEVAAAPLLAAQCVAGAVLLASTKVAPASIAATQKLFLGLASDVAAGKTSWSVYPCNEPALMA
jgi:hypothetical protein